MDVDLTGTWVEAEHTTLRGRVAVVIDVLRASTTIVAALEAGASRVIPVETPEEARAYAERMGHHRVVLGGERGAVRLPGFDLGNSPREYTPEAVAGRTVLLTTTNGTQAFLRARHADAAAVAALTNAEAVVRWLLRRRQDITVICAGTEGRLSLDDLYCGGLLISALIEPGLVGRLSDGARLAVEWYTAHAEDVLGVLRSCAHGQRLIEKGFADDLAFCAHINRSTILPLWDGEGLVRAEEE